MRQLLAVLVVLLAPAHALGSLHFDGTGYASTSTTGATFGTNAHAVVSLWLKTRPDATISNPFTFGWEEVNPSGFELSRVNSLGEMNFKIFPSAAATDVPGDMPVDVWFHVLIDSDNDFNAGAGRHRVFINGVLALTVTGVRGTTARWVDLGAMYPGSAGFYRGRIAELGVWEGVALTDAQIADLASGLRPSNIAGGLVAYYPMTELAVGQDQVGARNFVLNAGVTASADHPAMNSGVPTAPAPIASPAPATFRDPVDVTLSCSAPTPTIRFTTDGTQPTPSSPIYSAPVRVDSSRNLRAICQSSGYLDSAEFRGFYAILARGGWYWLPQYARFMQTFPDPPTVASFFASPSIITSGSATLTWKLYGATATSIDNGIGPVPVNGATTVSPASSISYSLTASNPAGTSAPAATTIMVGTSYGTMTTAHRTSGVAPLAVFFDAVDTVPETHAPATWSSGVYQPADREGTLYVWDFGDPDSGAWSTTGMPKNQATGFTAAHVYERPGIYTATLAITDDVGAVRIYSQTITVQDPETVFASRTYYVAADGSDFNDGRSPAAPFATIAHALEVVAPTTATGARILFRRGDSFTTDTFHNVRAPGPGIIGAYGSGPRPVINCTGTGYTAHCIQLSDGGLGRPYGTDWRVMDLDMVGPGVAGNLTQSVGPPDTRPTKDLLLLRVLARNWVTGLFWQHWDQWAYEHPNEAIITQECEVVGSTVISVWGGGTRIAYLGNDFHDGGNHILRIWQAHKAVISNNRLWNPGSNRLALKLHAPSYTAPQNGPNGTGDLQWDTRWVTITDNLLRPRSVQPDPYVYAMAIEPQDNINQEWIGHVVIERNRFFGAGEPRLDTHLAISAPNVMVRNNVFDATSDNAGGVTGVLIHYGNTQGAPPPANVRILNNTVYREVAGSEVYMVVVRNSASVSNLTVRNNLFSYPPASGVSALLNLDGTVTGLVQDHNLLTTAVADTVFRDVNTLDLTLAPASPAVDAGAALPEVRQDAIRVIRPRGSGHDLGAYESH